MIRTNPSTLVRLILLPSLAALTPACDGPPECVGGAGNLAEEVLETCGPPEDTPLDPRVLSGGAEFEADGTLVLTLSDQDIECGTRVENFRWPEACWWEGYLRTFEIPGELTEPQVIDLAEHPDVQMAETISDRTGGGRGTTASWPAGTFEIVSITESCVTGIIHIEGLATDAHPMDGAFVVPRC